MARDFRRELADAAAEKDMGALLAIAYQLLGRVEQDDERRARAAAKKAEERAARKLSATDGMSPNVAGRPATTRDIPDAVPPLTTNSTTTPPTAREAIAELGDAKLQTALDRVKGLMGEQWPDVAEFLLRRPYKTWQGWCDGMLRDVGMTSQFTPDDLATVCRDDATLDKRIGSAGVLRVFLGYARRERMGGEGQGPPPAGAARSGSTSRRDTKAVKPPPQAYTYPAASDPDRPLKWTP